MSSPFFLLSHLCDEFPDLATNYQELTVNCSFSSVIPLVYWADPVDSMFSEVPKKDAFLFAEDQIILSLGMVSFPGHVNIESEVQSNSLISPIPKVEDAQNSI